MNPLNRPFFKRIETTYKGLLNRSGFLAFHVLISKILAAPAPSPQRFPTEAPDPKAPRWHQHMPGLGVCGHFTKKAVFEIF